MAGVPVGPIECWLGHATFVSLIQSGLSSVFNTCYRFCRTHYSDAALLWPSVRDEIRAWKGLLVFLVQDRGRRRSELVVPDFPEAPAELLDNSSWVPRVWGAGGFPESALIQRQREHSAGLCEVPLTRASPPHP